MLQTLCKPEITQTIFREDQSRQFIAWLIGEIIKFRSVILAVRTVICDSNRKSWCILKQNCPIFERHLRKFLFFLRVATASKPLAQPLKVAFPLGNIVLRSQQGEGFKREGDGREGENKKKQGRAKSDQRNCAKQRARLVEIIYWTTFGCFSVIGRLLPSPTQAISCDLFLACAYKPTWGSSSVCWRVQRVEDPSLRLSSKRSFVVRRFHLLLVMWSLHVGIARHT